MAGFQEAVRDIFGSLGRIANSYYLASATIKQKYRRSVLGPLWITITAGLFIFFIAYIYSGFIQINFTRYLQSLALGWVIWQFISDSIVGGGQTFIHERRILQTTYIDRFTLVLKVVFVNLIVLAHNLLIAVAVFLLTGVHFSRATWLVIPGVLLIVLSAVSATTLFGFICARFRDFHPLLQATVRALFFVTPILWTTELLSSGSPRRVLADLNPLAHYVNVWRAPLMGEYPDPLSWIVVFGLTLVSLCAAFLTFSMWRRKIVFWV